MPPEDEERLLAAAAFMDGNECRTMIEAARGTTGLTPPEIVARVGEAINRFSEAARREFSRGGA